jgi:hypothetical protein
MIGWWILWYWLGLIIWTILASIMYINELTNDSEEETDKNILYFFLFLFAIWWIIQLFFNFIRISSQGSGGPFAWYKMSTGKTIELDNNLQQKETIITNYKWKDVFDLQFPHYNKFIELVKERPRSRLSIYSRNIYSIFSSQSKKYKTRWNVVTITRRNVWQW